MYRSAAGDQHAFATLHDRLQPRVFGLIIHVLRNRTRAEDTFQEVMHEAWCKAASYQASLGSVSAWMLMIARCRSIDSLRRRTSEHAEALTDEIAIEIDHDEPDSATVTATIRRVLEPLSADQHTLIDLAYYRGLTREQIAVNLGIPVGTVKTRIRRAIHSLR